MLGRALVISATLFAGASPAVAADQQPICADRPSKSTGPCTVPEGQWQIETGLIDWSRASLGGVHTDLTEWGSSGFKYGVSGNADIELWLTPLEDLTVRGSGSREHHSSFGDMLVRVKFALTPDNAPVQVALDPFVKLPTANHQLGNGKVEGGLLVPVQVPFGKSPITLSLDPELDLLADEDGHGRHLQTQMVVNLGVQMNSKLSFSTEVWAARNRDPAGTTSQASVDAAIAYEVTKDLQLDGGANLGLNRNTADVELYSGVSVRF